MSCHCGDKYTLFLLLLCYIYIYISNLIWFFFCREGGVALDLCCFALAFSLVSLVSLTQSLDQAITLVFDLWIRYPALAQSAEVRVMGSHGMYLMHKGLLRNVKDFSQFFPERIKLKVGLFS